MDRDAYFEDVRLQMEAKLWGEGVAPAQAPPKQVCGALPSTFPHQRSPDLELRAMEVLVSGPLFFSVLAAGNKTHCLWSLTGQLPPVCQKLFILKNRTLELPWWSSG